MKKTNALFATLMITGLLASCTKQRPEEFGQGQGSDLLSISDYQGATFDVATLDQLAQTKITNAQELGDSQIPGDLNNMTLVSYKSGSPLLSDLPLRAKAHTVYKFNYELTDKLLVINKIASRENLPFQEMTYAKKIGENLYSVPMIGYPISLIRVENVLDGNGEKTSRLAEFRAKSLEEATHFKVDRFNRVVFDAIKKNDVFPSSIFEGEWFYAATIVSAGLKNATSIGRDLSVDFEAESVSRIKFIPTPHSVRAVNTNLDSNIDRKDTINLQTAVEIPVNWVDFKVEQQGKNFEMREQKIDDSNKDAAHWSKRGFAEVDFANVKSILTKSNSALLENVEISEGFLSFTVHYTDEQIKIKYALKKAHRPVAGRIYKKDDRKVFGIFSTTKHFIDNHRFHRDVDYEKQIMMNRFYPVENTETGKKEIRYFFSSNTPENMKNAGRRAIKAWNETFKAAGTDIEVVLDESKSVSLGDIRYNIINLVDTKDGSGLLGYGPSIVDSESGEIISATTNIYANPFREGLINSIRNYIKAQIGLFDAAKLSTINAESIQIEKSSLEMVDHVMNDQKTNLMSRNNDLKIIKGTSIFKTLEEIESKSKEMLPKALILEQTHYGQKCSFEVTNADAISRIENNCKEQLDEYIEELKSSHATYTDRELEVVGSCAEKLLEDDVVATLVHEMGHNFGLRHNFLASTDKDNFKKNKEGKIVATSSTMDYSNGAVAELLEPGSYDEEAIRFAYASKVTLENGDIVDINANQSLKDQLSNKGIAQKKFKFCTDENVGETDPLCQRWDYGTNPLEVVQSIINNFSSSFEINGHKHDRAWGPNDLAFTFNHLQRTLLPLKMIHDQWRYHLSEFVTKRNQYLESFNAETFKSVLEQMKNDPGIHGENYRNYYEANVKAFEFLKSLLTTSARYCMVKSVDNEVSIDLIDFEKMKDDLYKESQVTIKSCQDISAIAKMREAGFEYIKSIGEFMNPQKVSLDITDPDFSKNETVGMKMLRRFASIILQMRVPSFKQHQLDNFMPNFIDNPIFRDEIATYLADRIVNGVTSRQLEMDTQVQLAIPLFDTEKDVLSFAYEMFMDGLVIPGKIESSQARRGPFAIIRTQDPSVELPEGAVETVFSSTRFIATNRNPVSKLLISKREELKKLKNNLKVKQYRITAQELIDTLSNHMPMITIEQIQTMTFKDLIAHFNQMAKVVSNVPQDNMLFTILNDFYDIEGYLISKIVPMVEQQSPDLLEKSATEAINTIFDGKLNVEIFSKEGLTERANEFEKNNEENIRKSQRFRANLIEYEAQMDMITEILLSI